MCFLSQLRVAWPCAIMPCTMGSSFTPGMRSFTPPCAAAARPSNDDVVAAVALSNGTLQTRAQPLICPSGSEGARSIPAMAGGTPPAQPIAPTGAAGAVSTGLEGRIDAAPIRGGVGGMVLVRPGGGSDGGAAAVGRCCGGIAAACGIAACGICGCGNGGCGIAP